MPLLGSDSELSKDFRVLGEHVPVVDLTQWPNMMGSEIFIIVAFRCSDSSTPWAIASAISLAKKSRSARRLITEEAIDLAVFDGDTLSLSTVVLPSRSRSSILSEPAFSMTADCSLP